MGTPLIDADEYKHPVGTASNWNESRYLDFWDPVQRIGGWFRIGSRPNEGRAEVSSCIYLPDGRVAFHFERAPITSNEMFAGGQQWEVVEPWATTNVRFDGKLALLNSGWDMVDPKKAFTTSPWADADIDLQCHSFGLESVMGKDQDHVDLIFLPGQADFHYQHVVRTTGTVRIGDQTWEVDGRGGKDHSWGPRNWHAKIYLRWQIGAFDDDHGFILTRAVGPTKKTRSGCVWWDGEFRLVDDYEMRNTYAGAPNYELRKVELTMHSGDRSWTAVGEPRNWIPARHRQPGADGNEALLRIVKMPVDWTFEGHAAAGTCEYHDLMVDGVPFGLDD